MLLLKKRVISKVEHVGLDPIFVEIESKRADVAVSAITMNDERKQSYDFSFHTSYPQIKF